MPASNWATRCNACGTSFRVSEAQLQVSDGFVRCGRCDAVFNARESLFDLELGQSAPMPLDAPTPSRPAPPMPAPEPAPAPAPAMDLAAAPPNAEAADADIDQEPVWDETSTQPMPSATERAEPSWVETAAEPAPASDDGGAANARLRDLLGVADGGSDPHPALSAEPAPWNSLVRERPKLAPRRRLWSTLAGLCTGLLVLGLPLQWAWIERDALRARWPQLDRVLHQHWPALGANGWRHLEGLSVSASSLQATPQGKAYRLELVLHNRAGHALAAPWLDLSLSDAQGQLLLRRALSPDELGSTRALQPGEQRRLQAIFQLNASARVAGYELGLFHP